MRYDTIVDRHTMRELVIGLTMALEEEIDMLREMPEREKIKLDALDPTNSTTCFLGQIYGQETQMEELRVSVGYRQKVGVARLDLGDYDGSVMTPLEVWSAYMWDINKELVMDVFRYIKGEIDTMPEVEYREVTPQLETQ